MAQPQDKLSRFYRTAMALPQASPELRAEFATEALRELAEVYIAETDLARNEAQEAANDSKLLRWSTAVDQLADQLLIVLDDIALGYPVAIALRRDSIVAVQAAGKLVMLTHPRMAQQYAYEQRVLANFCGQTDCAVLIEVQEPSQSIPLYAGLVIPQWSFSEKGQACSYEGVRVEFSDAEALAAQRDICQEFFQEVTALLTEISWQQLHGAEIDWPALAIRPTPGHTEHFVQLNAVGDTVLVTLPLLFSSPGLLQRLTPWLSAKTAGSQSASLLLNAGEWGWQTTKNRQ